MINNKWIFIRAIPSYFYMVLSFFILSISHYYIYIYIYRWYHQLCFISIYCDNVYGLCSCEWQALGQHFLRYWRVAWWHQALTCTNILQDMLKISFLDMSLKINEMRLDTHLPWANELNKRQWRTHLLVCTVYSNNTWTTSAAIPSIVFSTFIKMLRSWMLIYHCLVP